MATSGTTDFDLSVEEVIQEAYERCGLTTSSGYDLKTARRSLNILFSEWGNRGIHLWKVKLKEQLLTAGTITYTTPDDCADVLEAYVSSTTGTTSDTQDVSSAFFALNLCNVCPLCLALLDYFVFLTFDCDSFV